jgi:nicotinamide-nucleotide amidase
MNAEVIAVGSELLLGQISNTNAQYISKVLSSIGINVYYHTAVGDNRSRILDVLNIASNRSEIIILTGGLGPTLDDITKETLADFLGLSLEKDEISARAIEYYMKQRGRLVTTGNLKQAMFPQGTLILPNEHGTAPGAIIKKCNKTFVILPGPPFELKPMFEKYCLPHLAEYGEYKIVSKVLKIYGIGESMVEERIKDLLLNQSNPTIAPLAGYGDVTLRLTVKCNRNDEPEDWFNPLESEIRKRLGKFLYGTDDESLESVVAILLKKSKLSLSVAESCTGGLISDLLTNVPGISKSLNESIVVYSNQSKLKRLDVKEETLEQYGAVSEQAAIEMAKGIRQTSGSDIGLAVTGIAGPDGGTEIKPVGLVYIAIAFGNDSVQVQKHQLIGDRRRIKITAANMALNLLRLTIIENWGSD